MSTSEKQAVAFQLSWQIVVLFLQQPREPTTTEALVRTYSQELGVRLPPSWLEGLTDDGLHPLIENLARQLSKSWPEGVAHFAAGWSLIFDAANDERDRVAAIVASLGLPPALAQPRTDVFSWANGIHLYFNEIIRSCMARQTKILTVEDDDAAYRLLEIVFEELHIEVDLRRVTDGEQALAFLHQDGQFEAAARPDMILLNLNLPKLNGLQVLAAIRADESLKSIPTVVFSSSALETDRARCLALGAKQFITKPADFDTFRDAVRSAYAVAAAS